MNIMSEMSQSTTMWNSFDDVAELNMDKVLFSFEICGITAHVEKPYAEENEVDGEERFYPDDDWKVIFTQDVNTFQMCSDDTFWKILESELSKRFDLTMDFVKENVDRSDLLAQGNNYVSLECSSELVEILHDKGFCYNN
jgi:hypothetical protein